MVARVTLAALAPVALLGCTPEPANTVEMRQAVVELVDQGRAMVVEDAMTGLVGTVARGDSLPAIAAAVAAEVAGEVACAEVERLGDVALKITFGSPGAPCEHAGVDYLGTLRVVYTRPYPETLLATLHYEPLTGDATRLEGFTQLTWDEAGVTRVVTEIRIDAVAAREVEIQSDRLVARSGGQLAVDGWRRWETLMGRWEMDLAGFVVAPGEILPSAGLGEVDTPFNHTLVVDFSDATDSHAVRVNGGRRDRLFEVTAAGEVVDLGDG